MLVPVVRQVAAAHPELQVTMLSRKQVAPLFKNMPSNVHFYGADLKGRHRGIKGLNLLLKDIAYKQFDLIADMHNVLRSRWLVLRMLLAHKKVATLRKGRIKKWLLTNTRYNEALIPTIQRYWNVLNQLGIHVSRNEGSYVEHDRKGYGIAPFAAHQGKIYPLDKMEKVVEMLSMTGESVYLFGAGDKEREILLAWEGRYTNVYSLVGKYSMDEEIDLMGRLRVMITMDSANMHLASIAGTRVVSVWGATHPQAGFLGYGQKESDCVQRLDLACRPCSIYGNKPCKFGDYRCFNIDSEEIMRKIEDTK
jgi:ADP-heptose:LPS heptosyltransferase